jgi:hypothetical protein
MVARISFLERLAPGVVGHSAVRPALPPRFAPAPLEWQPGDPAAPDTADAVADALRDRPNVGPQRHVGYESGLNAPLPNVSAKSSPAAAAVPSGYWPRAGLFSVDPVAASAAGPAVASPGPVVLPSTTRDARAPALGGVAERRSTIPGAEDLETISGAPPPSPLVDTGAPLRETTVRQRAAAPATGGGPIEVHVTIDRIDVRAPAAAVARPAGPASQTRRAPSQSLADYLRERGQAGGSGGAR